MSDFLRSRQQTSNNSTSGHSRAGNLDPVNQHSGASGICIGAREVPAHCHVENQVEGPVEGPAGVLGLGESLLQLSVQEPGDRVAAPVHTVHIPARGVGNMQLVDGLPGILLVVASRVLVVCGGKVVWVVVGMLCDVNLASCGPDSIRSQGPEAAPVTLPARHLDTGFQGDRTTASTSAHWAEGARASGGKAC